MPELVVDVSPLIRMEAMMDRMAQGKLPNTTEAMRKSGVILFSQWRQSAADTASLYRKPDYLAGLVRDDSIREVNPLAIDIIHTQPDIARKVHYGVPSYDMKPDLVGTLRGQPRKSNPSIMGNAREIKNKSGDVVGRFNVIPFRHKTEDMGAGAYQEARALPVSLTRLSGGAEQKTQWGGRLSDAQVEAISKSPSANRAYEALAKAREARKMKAPTFEQFLSRFRGMTRVLKQYERTAQAQYMTFRTVSVRTDGKGGSPAGSWMFPGWSGRDFPREVMQTHIQQISEMIRKAVVLDFGL